MKLRGYRIELGEIESVMRDHPAVHDAVVTLGQENKTLVGYVVCNSTGLSQPSDKVEVELKSFLKTKLPDYMVPAHFVFLESFPMSPGGKVDRQSLPAPVGSRPGLEEEHVLPRTDVERRLATIFEKVLGVESVGVRDNFFDLGGHSLLAVRLVSEIEKDFGKRLPLVSFFEGANIEYLASLLREDVQSRKWSTLIEIQPNGENVPLFCVSMPNVNALGYRTLARYLGQNQPVFGLQAQYPEDLEGEHSQEAVDNIATEYLEALRKKRPKGPYQFVGLCRGAHIAYEMARRLEQEGETVAFLGILDTWVVENTYSIFFYLEHYADRLRWLTRQGIKNQISFIKKYAKGAMIRQRNPLHEVYFPGPGFVPRTYDGRIAVFRARKQPRQRIKDVSLGWSKLALGGVDVYFIPGGHTSVLQEPYVEGLAAELKKCLIEKE